MRGGGVSLEGCQGRHHGLSDVEEESEQIEMVSVNTWLENVLDDGGRTCIQGPSRRQGLGAE